jgi:hypothetical protein
MPIAYYMTFSKGPATTGCKVGGQPTLLPVEKPWSSDPNQLFGFVLELKVDGTRLKVPTAAYLQLYQSLEEGDDPLPIAVAVPETAPKNTNRDVLVHPTACEWAINFEEVEEPDQLPEANPSIDFSRLLKPKLGGLDPWRNDEGRTFLGHINEMPLGLNFGGTMCSLYLTPDGAVVAELN